MAFDRKVELKIGPGGTGLLISDLDISFEVERSNTFSLNTCRVQVFNASESTRGTILKSGNSLILSAGYADEGMGDLFIGNIVSSTSAKTGGDWVTSIEASALRSLNQPFEYVTLSLSFSPGTPITRALDQVGNALGCLVAGKENAAGILLTNGWAFAGTARQALAELRKRLNGYGVELYQDNAQILIYRKGNVVSKFRAVMLGYDSGLLSVRAKDDAKETGDQATEQKKIVEFTSLLNPAIQVNGLVLIRGTGEDGTYLVEKLRAAGDNFGQTWEMSGEAIA